MFCIGWFSRSFSLFAKLGCFVDNEKLFTITVVLSQGAVAADLFTKYVPGHFLN